MALCANRWYLMTMEMIEKWKAALMKPKETFASEKKNANLGASTKNLAISYLIGGFLFVIGVVITSPNPGIFVLILPFAILPIIFEIIIFVIFCLVVSFIFIGVLHVIAKLLGGNGQYSQLVYLYSLYAAPISILSGIPFIGIILGIVLGVYGVYLETLAIKEVYGLSTSKAILVWALPGIILLIIIALVAAALIATFLATVGLGAVGAANTGAGSDILLI